eukprot:CAMPEP_0174699602 /NCGR_PEP_ID=MMETSP1094-20130205/4829_1 /TAXON_ID=156173 /ORGANISM="Chrysochromulina brevifilum, Strain UTEX LB 985" /LENGTH=333 /DNA_ID=CAMNT_0015896969 /DNA_START=28 /DNA_END=1029 /DNA_ORIENTATION=+
MASNSAASIHTNTATSASVTPAANDAQPYPSCAVPVYCTGALSGDVHTESGANGALSVSCHKPTSLIKPIASMALSSLTMVNQGATARLPTAPAIPLLLGVLPGTLPPSTHRSAPAPAGQQLGGSHGTWRAAACASEAMDTHGVMNMHMQGGGPTVGQWCGRSIDRHALHMSAVGLSSIEAGGSTMMVPSRVAAGYNPRTSFVPPSVPPSPPSPPLLNPPSLDAPYTPQAHLPPPSPRSPPDMTQPPSSQIPYIKAALAPRAPLAPVAAPKALRRGVAVFLLASVVVGLKEFVTNANPLSQLAIIYGLVVLAALFWFQRAVSPAILSNGKLID